MKPNDLPAAASATSLLSPLLEALLPHDDSPLPGDARTATGDAIHGVVIGELLALAEDGATPLVTYPGQLHTSAVAARTSVDLHGQHIGAQIVLMFERGDVRRPIVVGILRGAEAQPLKGQGAQVEMDMDGRRLVVTARDQLVLRCGKASITLTRAGKVLIDGSYVASRSTGMNRVKGGSVQIN